MSALGHVLLADLVGPCLEEGLEGEALLDCQSGVDC